MNPEIEQLELPLYRGKIKNIKEAYGNISSKEYMSNYIEGYYFKYLGAHYIRTMTSSPFAIEVEAETLSISFPNMLDSNNDRMFASLSKSGKGGDILKCYLGINIENCTFREKTFKYQYPFRFTIGVYDRDVYSIIYKVGIQE